MRVETMTIAALAYMRAIQSGQGTSCFALDLSLTDSSQIDVRGYYRPPSHDSFNTDGDNMGNLESSALYMATRATVETAVRPSTAYPAA